MFYGVMKGVEYPVAVGLNYITLLLYCFEEVLARFLLYVLEKQAFFFFLLLLGEKMRGGCVSKHRRIKKNACIYLNLTYLHIFVTGPQVDLHVIFYVFHSCAPLCLCKCYFLSDIASFSFLPCVFFLFLRDCTQVF